MSVTKKRRHNRNARLETVIADIRLTHGQSAIQRGKRLPAVPHIPTSFPSLDQALGIGGIPRGRISEFIGAPTSGVTTLALKIIASAQAAGDAAIFIDLGETFNADYARRCQVDVSSAKLKLVRPNRYGPAMAILRALIHSGGAGIAVFSAPVMEGPQDPESLSRMLRQLLNVVSKSNCAMVFLCPISMKLHSMEGQFIKQASPLASFATVRLHVEKERWIKKGGDDIRGYQATVNIFKNILAPAGKQAQIDITFNGTVQGDGT